MKGETRRALPRPLADPLRRARTVLPYVFAGLITVSVASAVWALPRTGGRDAREVVGGVAAGIVLGLPFTGLVLYVLPRRLVNAFYLRSFRNDHRSWPIRKALQAALGRGFRLSGIRDPRRRMPLLLRPLAFMIFLFRYSTSKFMNLEAGDDWKARLWRSLGEARCAFLDLSDLTPFVEEEVRLCHQTLGLNRILFLGDESRSEQEWGSVVGGILRREGSHHDVQVVIWGDSPAVRSRFAATVRTFASQLPPGSAGVATEPPAPVTAMAEDGHAKSYWHGGQVALGLALAGLAWWLYAAFVPTTGTLGMLWIAPVALAAYILFLIIGYLFDCGSLRDRAVVVGCLGTYAALFAGYVFVVIVPAVEQVREQAYRMTIRSQLNQIGVAQMLYFDAYQRWPGHALYHDGRPVLSWRVAILPFLEEGDLYQQFHLDEPWDSPHNLSLLLRRPKVYAPPQSEGDVGRTHYMGVLGDADLPPREQAFFEAGPNRGRAGQQIPDGRDTTLLVVEAADSVPWTKPEDLRFNVLPTPGRESSGVFHALFCDGSVHVFSRKMPQDVLRSLITPAGGEIADYRLYEVTRP